MGFKKLNNIVGWFVFLIATVVYFLTLENTGYFLLRYYDLAAIFPLRSTALCVARTFLPPLAGTAVEPASAAAKVRINSQFTMRNSQLFFSDRTFRNISLIDFRGRRRCKKWSYSEKQLHF